MLGDIDTALNFRHITYKEKIERAYDELISTEPDKVMKRGRAPRDDMLGGIFGGKIYLIGAISGNGKTTFINQICRNVSYTGVKVAKYSLEDRMEDIGKEEIFYLANRYRIRDGLQPYKRSWFVCNRYYSDPALAEGFKKYTRLAIDELEKLNIVELDKTKAVSINDLVYLIKDEAEKGTRLFAIDHLHYFGWSSKDAEHIQITNAMHAINEVARRYNVAILLVAHYKKNVEASDTPDLSRFKGGSAIAQVSNIVIQLERDFDENQTTFHITKLRGPIKPEPIKTSFNLKTYEYEFDKSTEQLEREAKHLG